MHINPIRTTVKNIAIYSSFLCLAGIMGYQYKKDVKHAKEIKKELLEHPVNKYIEGTSEIEIQIEEISEPIFNKTGYWKIEAEKIRTKLDKKQQKIERLDSLLKHKL